MSSKKKEEGYKTYCTIKQHGEECICNQFIQLFSEELNIDFFKTPNEFLCYFGGLQEIFLVVQICNSKKIMKMEYSAGFHPKNLKDQKIAITVPSGVKTGVLLCAITTEDPKIAIEKRLKNSDYTINTIEFLQKKIRFMGKYMTKEELKKKRQQSEKAFKELLMDENQELQKNKENKGKKPNSKE